MRLEIKWVIFLSVNIVLSLLIGIFYFTQKESPEVSILAPENELTPEQLRDRLLIAEARKELEDAKRSGDKDDEKSAMRKFAQALGGKASAMFGMSLDGMVEHTLHGIVLDQYDRPVGGAKVYTMYGNSGFMQGYGDYELTTDMQGRFVSKGTGGGVTILNVLHPEITRWQTTYESINGGIRHDFTLNLTSANNTPDNPRVLRVWRVEQYADVKRFGGAGNSLTAPSTGEPSIENHLKLTCIREPYVGFKKKSSSWSMKLETAEPGGFQIASDTYLNMAPIDGYDVQTLEAKREFGSEGFSKFYDFHQVYYFKSGSHYGVFKLMSFSPFGKGKNCHAMLNMGRYNNEGTRDLAVPPEYEGRY